MATTKITSPDLFNLESLNTALKLPSGTTAERPTSPSTGEWRYNTTTNLVEFWDGGAWRDLQSENIPPINSENFNTVLYTGNSSTQSITGVGFKPDWVWIKERGPAAENHNLIDSTRGTSKILASNNDNPEFTSTRFTSFDADGFTLANNNETNDSGSTYVAWCWKANGGTTSSNTDGTITSTVQVNTKAGFSIMRYTGNGTSGATIGHGLGAAPDLIISRNLTSVTAWGVYHKYNTASPAGQRLKLDLPDLTLTTNDYWAGVEPTSTVLSVGTEAAVNDNTKDYIMYAFKAVAGYSAFGSYAGNASDNGPILNTGFEPAWLMIKVNTGSADGWFMVDNKRETSNPRGDRLFANSDVAEASEPGAQVDFLSNGFQIRGTGGGQGQVNSSGSTYVYIAFAADASAAPALPDSFANKLYTGNGSTQLITGLGFSPSLVWLKERGQAANHRWLDTIRGATNAISSSLTNAQFTDSTGLTSFNTDGFTLGANVDYNNNGGTFVSWNWKANPVPTINTDGTIQSVVSANQAAGFSIVKWNGTGSASTVGHGLSAAPEIILTKRLNGTGDWYSFSTALNSGTNPAYNFIKLNSSDSEIVNGSSGGSIWNSTSPTATVINVGTTLSGSTSDSYIAYCFTSIAGFSKMGTYTGTGATHAITGVGFQPDWIMGKEVDGVDSWEIVDSARGINKMVYANGSNAEVTNTNFTSFDSDGFTLSSATSINQSGQTYIYMAFKENPSPIVPAGYMAYLTVAGGGGGGVGYLYSNAAGGGGAGGLRTSFGSTSGGGASAESNLTLTSGTYTVTIGAGGQGGYRASTPPLIRQFNGNDSSITGNASITSTGGGYGGAGGQDGGTGDYSGAIGGSGGGGSGFGSGAAGTANQGYAGAGSRGGGGASAAGSGANGGDGLSVSITSSATAYAGGGGAGGQGSGGGGSAGTGGGGQGGQNSGGTTSGTANTGGGGGGGQGGSGASGSGTGWYGGGAGGSGVVVLRMRTTDYSGTTTGSPTITTRGEETILTYTGSGTYVHS